MILRVVLDASAVSAYTESTGLVGELLAELADETARLADSSLVVGFGVPDISLATAAAQAADADMIGVLMRHPLFATETEAIDTSDWVSVAGQLGNAETAAVVLLAMTADAYVVTRDVQRYAVALLDGLNIITLTD
ncbi:hypothetical protein F4553_001418 [Allocatelliglobosispora scoriae]|uniref:PIN domain-containing protein n=1 Tax=Allocatelliglobosispora scoriae TaxID=643052 RepID=A0A841BLG4_9ACTN|nr:hypothetical protein [Allocatelliglobosispora scoriae]MBB5868039.1 hypothetical protein [Allocatelliglobosispora scoriae]